MFTLLQIIIYMNYAKPPEINILTHFDSMNKCEKKIEGVKKRYKKNTIDAKIKSDHDGNIFLTRAKQGNKISYWFCKEAVFYKD